MVWTDPQNVQFSNVSGFRMSGLPDPTVFSLSLYLVGKLFGWHKTECLIADSTSNKTIEMGIQIPDMVCIEMVKSVSDCGMFGI